MRPECRASDYEETRVQARDDMVSLTVLVCVPLVTQVPPRSTIPKDHAHMPTAPHQPACPESAEQRGDAELIVATRDGDTTAYAELYERHVDAASRLARILTHDRVEADDLVSETFAKLLAVLRGGRGPDLAFRAYLLTTLRNTFYDRARRDRKVEFTDDLSRHDTGEPFEDTAVAGQERRYAARAFRRLPERWQVVLWHTEVEGETAAQVAPLLGLTPNGVSALAYRARERLKQMYLQEHIADSPAAECRWTADRLGARVRGGLSPRDEIKVDDHRRRCTACELLFTELAEVNSGIRGVVAPLVLGVTAPAYLAGLAAKGAAAASLAQLGRQAVNWIRRGAQQLGGKGIAATSAAAAVIAGIVVLVLMADSSPSAPPAPDAQAPMEQPSADPSGSLDDPPVEPGDEPSITPSDEPSSTPSGEPSEDEPQPPPGDFTIGTDLTAVDLVAGSAGTVPVELSAPKPRTTPMVGHRGKTAAAPPLREESAGRLSMLVDLPAGMTAESGAAGDGWQCRPEGAQALCERAGLAPGAATAADVPVDVGSEVTGFQDVKVSVSGGHIDDTADLRVPVAPAETGTGFASRTATGVAAAGNTLSTCVPTRVCRWTGYDNDMAVMTPYTANSAPPGLGRGWAASGARLDVPAGAEVLWAGLYWAGSDGVSASQVRLSVPGGGWNVLSGDRHWNGRGCPVAQSAADVTATIAGTGEYWVAVPQAELPVGIGQYAGWSLTVVYREAGAADREAAVYEGLAQPAQGEGLSVALGYGGDVDVAYTLWDGDRSRTGDNLDVSGVTVGQPGNLGRGHSPSALEGEDWNTLGVDVAVYRATADAGRVRLYAGDDLVDVAVLTVVAPPP